MDSTTDTKEAPASSIREFFERSGRNLDQPATLRDLIHVAEVTGMHLLEEEIGTGTDARPRLSLSSSDAAPASKRSSRKR